MARHGGKAQPKRKRANLWSSLKAALRGQESPSPTQSGHTLFDQYFQKRLETLAIVSKRVFNGKQRSERRSKKKGSGVEFADHRNYSPGDDIRFVDFRAYERFGRLLVRLFEEEEDLSVYFIVDSSLSMGFGGGEKFDQARRLCAALAYVALANLDRVTIVTAGDQLEEHMPTTRGKGQVFKVLRFLEALKPSDNTNLGAALRTFVARYRRRGLAVLISDLYDPNGFEHGINMLRYNKFEPYVLHIVNPQELSPEVRGDVRLVDCETREQREVTLTDTLLEKIQQQGKAYQNQISHFCHAHQVPYFPASTDDEFDELVLQVFRRGGFLR